MLSPGRVEGLKSAATSRSLGNRGYDCYCPKTCVDSFHILSQTSGILNTVFDCLIVPHQQSSNELISPIIRDHEKTGTNFYTKVYFRSHDYHIISKQLSVSINFNNVI